jgi:hypothetical protein
MGEKGGERLDKIETVVAQKRRKKGERGNKQRITKLSHVLSDSAEGRCSMSRMVQN